MAMQSSCPDGRGGVGIVIMFCIWAIAVATIIVRSRVVAILFICN